MMEAFTIDELESLIDLIECNIFPIIRNDEDIDNINWLCNICSAYRKMKERVDDQNELCNHQTC